MNWGRFLLSPNGRTSRGGYWLMIGIVIVISIFGMALDRAFGTYDTELDSGVFEIIASIIVIWPSIVVAIKRFHDRGMSGWWIIWFVLLTMAPLVPLIFINAAGNYHTETGGIPMIGFIAGGIAILVQLVQFVILAALPGQSGENKYGPNPLGE